MSHNHMMSNQQQMTVNPVTTNTQQRSQILAQRDLNTHCSFSFYEVGQETVCPKSTYQMPPVSLSQLGSPLQKSSQAPQLLVHNSLSTDISSLHRYSSSLGSLQTQNGRYQKDPDSSPHSNLRLESSQLGVQYQTSQVQQLPASTLAPTMQSSYHYQSQSQTLPTQPQHILSSSQPPQLLQPQHHQQQQIQIQQQPIQIQHKQNQQPTYQQQHLHLQQQLQHKNQQQQPRIQKQLQPSQPRHILQHPGHSRLTTPVQPQSPTLAQMQHQPLQPPSPQQPQCPTDTSQAPQCKTDMAVTVDDKSELESPQETTNNATEKLVLANTKEKTPMCLINELARFNKINHQYTLVDEQGPAHKKTFYIKLKLSEEEYSASGDSIKKAQHAAAAIALVYTKYPHPPPKPARLNVVSATANGDEHITPTVELNALAMKRGETAVYKSIEPQQPPAYYQQPSMDFRGLYNQRYHTQYMRSSRDPHVYGNGVLWPLRYHYPRVSRAFYVSLRVGQREFIGDGPTRQAARHNAAQKALRILKNLPVQDGAIKKEPELEEEQVNETDSLKSEISLVHEVALRRNMPVSFEVVKEAGPPHMKNFITKCHVGDIVTEGEGTSKKSSKKKAAELMLEELQGLPPAPSPTYLKPKTKLQINKKKNRNLIKSELQQQKADPSYGVGINPISRLIQIMQAQKKKEPVYTLLAEKGLPRRREFVMQVEVEGKTCTGIGPNKKLAKRAAAESMLQVLGYTKPSPQPVKSAIKNSTAGENGSNGDKKVTFVEGDTETGGSGDAAGNMGQAGQQKVPGLLHIPTSNTKSAVSFAGNNSVHVESKEPLVNLTNILKPNLRPEIQLRKLCKALGYEIEVDDFTKKRPEGTEHIARITIGPEIQQSFHGSSNSLESSRDNAALDALKILLAKVKDIRPGGDGPHVKKEILRPAVNLQRETIK